MFKRGSSVQRIMAAARCSQATIYRIVGNTPHLSKKERKRARGYHIETMFKRGWTFQEIAKATGWSQPTIYRVLANNPELRAGRSSYLWPEKEERNRSIIRLSKRGQTIEEIVAAVGCSRATVSRVLRRKPQLRVSGSKRLSKSKRRTK
jgi:DNA-binding LacI/PurR family transcriptional regulator